MSLPETTYITYPVKLPVSGLEVRYRPYKVKEQKLLLMEKESGDRKSWIDTINQIINNCVVSKNIADISTTDKEFLFYQLRARSESETVILKYRCENILDGGEVCENVMTYPFNLLNDIDVTSGVDPVVDLGNGTIVKMKYQQFEYSEFDDILTPTPEQLFEEVAKQIDFITTNDAVYSVQDVPKQQIVDWLGDLTVDQYSKIENFMLNEPKIKKDIQITCKKCGMVHDIEVEDLYDFFM